MVPATNRTDFTDGLSELGGRAPSGPEAEGGASGRPAASNGKNQFPGYRATALASTPNDSYVDSVTARPSPALSISSACRAHWLRRGLLSACRAAVP